MVDLLNLQARIVLDSAKFKRGLREASDAARKAGGTIGGKLAKAGQQASDGFVKMAAAAKRARLAVAAIGTAVVATAEIVSRRIRQVQLSAETLGTTTQEFQALSFAFKTVGLDAQDAVDALRDFQEKSGEAAQGTGELYEALQTLGLNTEEFIALPLVQRLGLLADELNKVDDQGLRTALAIQAIGDDGGKLLPLLAKGSTGLALLGQRFVETGGIISDDGVSSVEEYRAAVTDLSSSVKGLVDQLTVQLLPALTKVANGANGIVNPLTRAAQGINETLTDVVLSTQRAVAIADSKVSGFMADQFAKGAVIKGAMFGADAGAADLNRATDLQRRAGQRRAEAGTLTRAVGLTGTLSGGSRAPGGNSRTTNPLAGAGGGTNSGRPSPAAAGGEFFGPPKPAPAGLDVGTIVGAIGKAIGSGAASAIRNVVQQAAQVQGVTQGVDTAFGTFQTGEQVTLLRAIRDAVEKTAEQLNSERLLT